MNTDYREYDLGQWQKLDEGVRINIINHYWEPYNPQIGQRTKREILEAFIDKTKGSAHQYGIRGFGWTVCMLHVVFDTPSISIPSKFLGLPINKGIIINRLEMQQKVKFDYGGT
jgi:hypothetical protein